jgi:hypothetical protein
MGPAAWAVRCACLRLLRLHGKTRTTPSYGMVYLQREPTPAPSRPLSRAPAFLRRRVNVANQPLLRKLRRHEDETVWRRKRVGSAEVRDNYVLPCNPLVPICRLSPAQPTLNG